MFQRKHVFPTGTGNGWTMGWRWWMSVQTRPPRTGAKSMATKLLAGDDSIVEVATGKVTNPVGADDQVVGERPRSCHPRPPEG